MLIAVVLVSAMGLAACSGGHGSRAAPTTTATASTVAPSTSAASSSTTTTSVGPVHPAAPALVAQADAICQEEAQKIQALNSADLATYLPGGLATLQAERAQLGALKPGAADQATFGSFLSKLDQTIAAVAQAVSKLPDQAAAKTAFSAAAKPAQAGRDIATTMGIGACGNPPPKEIPVAHGPTTAP